MENIFRSSDADSIKVIIDEHDLKFLYCNNFSVFFEKSGEMENVVIFSVSGFMILKMERDELKVQKDNGVILKICALRNVSIEYAGCDKFCCFIFVFNNSLLNEVILNYMPLDECSLSIKRGHDYSYIKSNEFFMNRLYEHDQEIRSVSGDGLNFNAFKKYELMNSILSLGVDIDFIMSLLSVETFSIIRMRVFMKKHYLKQWSLEVFAKEFGCSLSNFKSTFSQAYNSSPKKWLKEQRLNASLKFLLSDERSISDIAFELSFSDAAHFTNSFKKNYGLSPTEFKRLYAMKALEV